ncbi:MAG: glycosyl hydrolase, partial [Aliifodinibius sp.]|nr:glycosyl hydrolase [Fodinibius sp.]NIV14390.1 glycosyl hydrolase [Fodinibius sp.]NIY28216.1 glycosyl hydrolase [Fodinibius sp.]
YQRKAGGITSGIYKSTDGGTNWNLLSNGLPPPSTTLGRIGVAISPTNPDVLYAIYADHPGYFDGVYRTTDGGNSWYRVNDGSLSNMYSSFGWYFGNIFVDPTNENIVYALGLSMHKSSDGGNNWSSIAWGTHVDHHAIWVNPNNPQSVVIGN